MTRERHPLDPLSEREVRIASESVLRHHAGAPLRFVFIDLREPEKAALSAWLAGSDRPPRHANVVARLPAEGATLEGVVDLGSGDLLRATRLDGVQAAITPGEYEEAEQVAKADPRVLEALSRRGIDDPELVMIDAWSVGRFEDPAVRAARGLAWLRADLDGDNGYARPIGNLVVVVDLDRMRVVRVDDHGPLPVPTESGDYRDGGGQPLRAQAPLHITQPEGPTFTLEGNLLHWSHWTMRVGVTAREGLVLHEIAWDDGRERRSILHRASLAELIVPYGDPNPTVHFKNAFDVGEFGLGPLLNSLERSCDCLGEIRYLDAVMHDDAGSPVTIPNAICIHEEDQGLLWKHTDTRSGRVDRVRSRRLIVSSIATVGNYEYGLYWWFQQDGSLGLEVKLTGVMHTAGIPEDVVQNHATIIAPGVSAPYHQHFFCARLDFDVDGTANTVCETEAESCPISADNPDGIAFVSRSSVLDTELAARRNCEPLRARRWRVQSAERCNRLGEPTAFELVPLGNVSPMQDPESVVRRRARVLEHHLWVTQYHPNERFPAGDYPNQHDGADGLPRWTEADRPLRDQDVVLWYTFGEHHVPRLEDWPVMPVAPAGFVLRPIGFFDHNPALDVPPPC